ncbi:MAG: hypothetical protein Q8862_01050 [Bacteroidota bacterium]|nr:hypothetical protein [Bacteroidota bacterium]
MKRIICEICILLFIGGFRDVAYAQNYGQPKNWKPENIQVGVRMGVAQIATEVKSNFSSYANEFRNTPNASYGIFVSSEFIRNLEAGLDLGYSRLLGDANGYYNLSSQFYNPDLFGQDLRYNYKTNLYTATLFLNYHLPNFYQSEDKSFSFNPYLSVGAGLSMFKGNLYRDSVLIYQKEKGMDSKHPFATNFLGGIGMRYTFNQHLLLTTEYNLNLVSTDALDMSHNYKYTDPAGTNAERLGVYGLVGRFLIGLSWRFGYYDNSSHRSSSHSGNSHKRKSHRVHYYGNNDNEIWYAPRR